MSVRIGQVNARFPIPEPGYADVHVLASVGGVELHSEPELSLTPVEARNYAALLVRAADEVERMRRLEADDHWRRARLQHELEHLQARAKSDLERILKP